jgi:hypothetical protein
MGTTLINGVVSHAGEVFNYKNLYVADAAIIPEALGVNPSRTIGALAERYSWDVYDPQRESAPKFTSEAAIERWRAINGQTSWPAGGRAATPAALAMRVWEWNDDLARVRALLAKDDRSVYLPRMLFGREPGAPDAFTWVLWPAEVCALALPAADYLVYRKDPDDPGTVIDRDELLASAAYYVTALAPTGLIEER